VLGGLVAGRVSKRIAFDLAIKLHRANLMDKMQSGRLSEFFRMALIIIGR
jgi:FixJ family two-component response regulator